jgi:hypothetical protein
MSPLDQVGLALSEKADAIDRALQRRKSDGSPAFTRQSVATEIPTLTVRLIIFHLEASTTTSPAKPALSVHRKQEAID